jgi:general L-amino acid transport system substrate-binding protein
LKLDAVVKDKRGEAEDAFFAGQCDALSADSSELAEAVIGKARVADDFAILATQLTKEPLAPLLRKGDDQFFDVVRWTIFGLVDAEELGIGKDNVDAMRADGNPDVKRFFAPLGQAPGFAPDWSYRIVKATGNYGEIFDRALGAKSPAKLPRGFNRVWTRGGLMYAPPVR